MPVAGAPALCGWVRSGCVFMKIRTAGSEADACLWWGALCTVQADGGGDFGGDPAANQRHGDVPSPASLAERRPGADLPRASAAPDGGGVCSVQLQSGHRVGPAVHRHQREWPVPNSSGPSASHTRVSVAQRRLGPHDLPRGSCTDQSLQLWAPALGVSDQRLGACPS